MTFTEKILANEEISPGYFRMKVTAPEAFLSAHPGQFVMVRMTQGVAPLLRRPLGIMDMGKDPDGAPFFELLYRVVGNATSLFASLASDGKIDVLGPLGTGFQMTNTQEHWLIGGGIGLPPLYFLARRLREAGKNVHLFAGGRTKNDVVRIPDFEAMGVSCHIATESGEWGIKGRVTEPLLRYLEDKKSDLGTIYACGPDAMLRAIAALAQTKGVAAQVSLENYMACGVGACLGCVAPGKDHSAATPDYRCVCKEGPVFDVNELLWERP